MMKATVIGGGLAGSEATWQLVRRGHQVSLFEMRPTVMTPAHKSGLFAELVCSNSLRGAALSNAVGLLKEELRQMGSLIMEAADATKLPAGGALAVDREAFSSTIDRRLRKHPLVEVVTAELDSLPPATSLSPLIIATGPLTSPSLAKRLFELSGDNGLSFYDAISPVVFAESIKMEETFRQSRYDKGSGDDYLNIPLSREEYYAFVEEVQRAEKHSEHLAPEEDSLPPAVPFEGCMPIEDMIARGPDTLRFGPWKPKGLTDPRTGRQPFAVLQLRQDNHAATLWNMVGMQTRMKHGEQRRIFRSLPGLAHAEFARLGSVHRNTFLNSPNLLTSTYQLRQNPACFLAGQITGIEGYVESTASGLVAGLNAARMLSSLPPLAPPPQTAIGALAHYVSNPEHRDFQPMNINFGIVEGYDRITSQLKGKSISKAQRREAVSKNALEVLGRFKEAVGGG